MDLRCLLSPTTLSSIRKLAFMMMTQLFNSVLIVSLIGPIKIKLAADLENKRHSINCYLEQETACKF